MINFKIADYCGTFHGFNLKPGFFYGTTGEGQAVASSGWECNDALAVYYLNGRKWELHWIDPVEEGIQLESLPTINTDGKLSFGDWVEEFHGISMNDFDESYSEVAAKQLEYEYDSYYYDGLPRFIQRLLQASESNQEEEL